MMRLEFTKMHGLGNDFILLDGRGDRLKDLPGLAMRLSHRQLGIGFDQALVLSSSKVADFRMDIYNADGGKVEMCGNGIRCFAKYIWDKGLSKNDPLCIETMAGIVKPTKAGKMIKVDMGKPILEGRDIPVNRAGKVIDYPLTANNECFLVTCVSMGNPHAVTFVDDLDRLPVSNFGPEIEKDAFFPNKTNVEFVEVINRKEIKVKVWERGSGETLACGTGACASMIASNLKGYTDRNVTVHLPGGDLNVEWSQTDDHVYMTGPAVQVFEGVLYL